MAKSVNRDINTRIKAICDSVFKGNLSQMAKSTYISRTTLISIIGEQQSTPGYDVLRKIVEMSTASINETWLLTGEGEMYSKENPVPQISYTDGAPYYDESFELGFDELMAPSYENPEYLIRMPGYEKATLWCNASGHSMEPEINNGDIVALRRIDDFSFLPFGDIYGIITTNGLRTIKRLGKSATPGCYRLIPTNPEYDEQDIPLEKILIVYRVMGAMKSF
ncbi:S24 family peptidase [uncultured Duncaniella sp.]|uniref:S24 family peptidase n=2 Tax=Muribaculaceae TaxID=2005473 RepID=UPI0025B22275|nr:S24 family peptidase [uncultured Duncaniella sp.]